MKNMKLGTRLYLGFGAVIVILIILAVLSINTVSSIEKADSRMESSADIMTETLEIRSFAYDYHMNQEEEIAVQIEEDYGHLLNYVADGLPHFDR